MLTQFLSLVLGGSTDSSVAEPNLRCFFGDDHGREAVVGRRDAYCASGRSANRAVGPFGADQNVQHWVEPQQSAGVGNSTRGVQVMLQATDGYKNYKGGLKMMDPIKGQVLDAFKVGGVLMRAFGLHMYSSYRPYDDSSVRMIPFGNPC